jgi:hypothetical protein
VASISLFCYDKAMKEVVTLSYVLYDPLGFYKLISK